MVTSEEWRLRQRMGFQTLHRKNRESVMRRYLQENFKGNEKKESWVLVPAVACKTTFFRIVLPQESWRHRATCVQGQLGPNWTSPLLLVSNTYLVALLGTALLETPIATQLLNKFPKFSGTRKLGRVCASACHWQLRIFLETILS